MSGLPPWIAAAEAARLLGVNRATLYAYVSRGYLRSQAAPGSPRERMYSRDDVERLRRRTEERRAPDKAAARALQWGMPILESSISLVEEMPQTVQDTLIELLDGLEFTRRPCDAVRLISGTTVSLLDRIAAGTFSDRLFYRLNIIHLMA